MPGNRVGEALWSELASEHGLDPTRSFSISGTTPFEQSISGIAVNFNETPNGKYATRF